MTDLQIKDIRFGKGPDRGKIIYASLYRGEQLLICATLEHIQNRLPEVLKKQEGVKVK